MKHAVRGILLRKSASKKNYTSPEIDVKVYRRLVNRSAVFAPIKTKIISRALEWNSNSRTISRAVREANKGM